MRIPFAISKKRTKQVTPEHGSTSCKWKPTTVMGSTPIAIATFKSTYMTPSQCRAAPFDVFTALRAAVEIDANFGMRVDGRAFGTKVVPFLLHDAVELLVDVIKNLVRQGRA